MKVYIAGPLFTEGERWFLEKIDGICAQRNLKTFLPHRDVDESRSCQEIFEQDLKELKSADTVIAVLDGLDVDSGTAFEIGVASTLGKYIIGIKTDFRAMAYANRANPLEAEMNLMIRYSINGLCRDLKELEEELLKFTA
jgi:nucleoside 2-deoxyribosyltransferase